MYSNLPSTSKFAKGTMEINKEIGAGFLCEVCCNVFTTLSKLHKHKLVHQKSMNKSCNIFYCKQCGDEFTNKLDLKNHKAIHVGITSLNCEICDRGFKTHKGLENHKKTHQNKINCSSCQIDVGRLDWGHHLRSRHHKESLGVVRDFTKNIKIRSSDFMERIEVYTYSNPKLENLFVEEFFEAAEEEVMEILEESLAKQINFKCNFELQCLYIKKSEDTEKLEIMSHVTKMMAVNRSHGLRDIYLEKADDIKTKMSEFQERDSGWALHQISNLNININKHNIVRGSSYINMPYKLSKLNACLNIKNDDIYCFKWCIVAALRNPSNPQKATMCSSYNIDNIERDVIKINEIEINFSNIKFPIDVKDINIFESQNPYISINVFGFDVKGNQIIGPYRVCEKYRTIHISLMLLENEDCSKRHYVLIKDLSRYVIIFNTFF